MLLDVDAITTVITDVVVTDMIATVITDAGSLETTMDAAISS